MHTRTVSPAAAGYARGDRGEARDRDDAQTRRVRKSLHHPGSDSQPGERARPAPEGEAVEFAQRKPGFGEQGIDEGQDEIGMAALGQRLAQGQHVGREQRD